MIKVWWATLGVALVGVSAAFVWKTVHSRSTALPVFEHVPAFELKDSTSRPMTRDTLRGTTWVADFIYTNCPDQCPMMSRHMEALQGLLPKESTVQLVSISVDPKRDTAQVLAGYAQRYHADPSRWHFLTGSPDTIQALLTGLKLTPPDSPPAARDINHSSRMVLVDPAGDVRGYYDATDADELHRLVKDLSAFSK